MLVASSTVENYLKQLYLEQRARNGSKVVPTGRLAAAMGVVPGTATSMVKALADSGLVEYESRAGVRLTGRGEQLALHVLRRHRLLELFLVETLGLDWSEVHTEADALEHAVSDRVIERIDALLGHPKADPHGDPIPTGKGDVDDTFGTSLADCPLKTAQKVVRVLDQGPEFLRYVQRQGLMPGATVIVQSRETAAQAVEIRVSKRLGASLGLTAAQKILVQPAPLSKSTADKHRR
jgi:DtxR family Mn-dependent transcriptional regulator